jgi:hypothetical protein
VRLESPAIAHDAQAVASAWTVNAYHHRRMPTVKLLPVGLLAALATSLAVAQTPPPPPGDGGADNAQRQAQHAAVLAACDADIKSLCADQQGRGVMRCLRSNGAQLSTGCKSAMPKHHAPGGTAPAPST